MTGQQIHVAARQASREELRAYQRQQNTPLDVFIQRFRARAKEGNAEVPSMVHHASDPEPAKNLPKARAIINRARSAQDWRSSGMERSHPEFGEGEE